MEAVRMELALRIRFSKASLAILYITGDIVPSSANLIASRCRSLHRQAKGPFELSKTADNRSFLAFLDHRFSIYLSGTNPLPVATKTLKICRHSIPANSNLWQLQIMLFARAL
jgi:hypothetical protein